MCRDILNSCVRNTEDAERNAQAPSGHGGSGRGLAKGVWGMIEESELAKTIRLGEEKKVILWFLATLNFGLNLSRLIATLSSVLGHA
jgi:hypothetical protein